MHKPARPGGQKIERQELQISALAVRENESRALLAHLRQVDLGVVITALGGQRDGERGPSTWRLGGEVISIAGEKFHNHTRQQEGSGAIALVQHATGYEWREAVAWLHHQVGPELAVLAAARHAQSIGQRDPMPPFRAPEPDSQRWIQVRAYLTDQCGIPSQWIDYLHDRGTIYADRRANAVFVQHNDQGEATGAYLHGTSEERPFQGLAPGTRRDAGCFQVTLSATQNAGRACPTLIIAESPIEALSVLEIYRRGQESKEHGPVTVLSMDGAGTFPQQHARETLERGGVVHVATKENQVCERAWQELREQYPTQVRRDRPARQEVLGDSRTTQPSRTPGRETASVRLPEAEEGQ